MDTQNAMKLYQKKKEKVLHSFYATWYVRVRRALVLLSLNEWMIIEFKREKTYIHIHIHTKMIKQKF